MAQSYLERPLPWRGVKGQVVTAGAAAAERGARPTEFGGVLAADTPRLRLRASSLVRLGRA